MEAQQVLGFSTWGAPSTESSSSREATNLACHSDIDFTLVFEEIALSLVPTTCFLLLAVLRILQLRAGEHGKGHELLKYSKLSSISFLGAINVAILATVAQQHTSLAPASLRLASATLTVLATLSIGLVSYFEHVRETRPSFLLNACLPIFLVIGIIRTRTAWLLFSGPQHEVYPTLCTAATAVTGLITILEAVPKRRRTGRIALQLDDKSPEQSSGLYALTFFTWLNPLIRLGNEKILDTDDLYPLDTRLSADRVSAQFQKYWADDGHAPGSGERSLWRRLLKSLFRSLLWPIPSRAAMVAFSFCQPFFIQSLIRYLESGSAADCNTGAGLIMASICIYGGIVLSTTSYNYLNSRTQTKLRSSLVTSIFQHTVELKATHLDTSILTLMSTDVERVQTGFQPIHDIWANIVEVVLASWLLYRQLGTAFLAPLVIVLVCAIATTGVSSFARPSMISWTKRTEERVKLTSAVVGSMKPVKMSGLAGAVAALLQRFRADEISAGTGFRTIMLFSVGNAFLPQYLAPLATFAFAGRKLSVAEVFASLSYLSLVTMPLNQLFQKIPMILASAASLKRIQDFLVKENDEDYRVFESQPDTDIHEGDPAISLHDVKAGWTEGKWQLSDLSVTIPKSQITIITGPVASGKSTLCKALLGEAAFTSGLVKFHQPQSRIGYCDQTPFLVNGSIRANIIGFAPFDGTLYDDILETVLLKSDLRVLPLADQTQIGSSGVTLSGGQKQRVALARALYLSTDTFVLDDFTVGLDKSTADEIVRRLFRADGFLVRRRKATVVWCTHSIQYLHLAKHIVALGSDGRILHQGGPDEVLKDQEVTLALENDESQKGSREIGSDIKLDDTPVAKPESDKSASRALTEASVYKHYFSSFGPLLMLSSILTVLAFGFTSNAGPVWLKFWADNTFAVPNGRVKAFYLGIYAIIQVLALVTLVAFFGLVIIGMAKASGRAMHLRAVTALMGAPLRYLTKTDQGVIVNFFSQDMNMVDMALPGLLMNTGALALLSLGQAIVVVIGTPFILYAYPVLIVVLWRVTKYYLTTSRQLRLLELENKSPLYTQFADTVRGIASLRAFGWTDAYIAQNHHKLDDAQRPLYLLGQLGTWLGLVLRLVVTAIAVGVTVLSTQISALHDRAGFVGAGFVALMSFGSMLNSVVQCWVQLEMSLGAVKRLKEFGETAGSEDHVGEDLRPGETWPERGEIVLGGVDASYAEERYKDDPEEMGLALKGVSLTVSAGEKVALVGRTGSGKSSLLLLLLRLLDPSADTAGGITIDGLPLRRIHRETLRQRVIAMPQDMVFLAAGETFRAALDPYARATDAECCAALEEVGLLEAVKEAGGLEGNVEKDTLSQGQKQLFSLAIAVLRTRAREKMGARGGVLLLDEVTSNVDRETEKIIMEVVARVFKEYSVVAVTHSLESVVDFDKVFVMAEGRVVKEGTPQALIKDGEGTT
ncbi:unnamed protein product [Discula destructiva]